jgi:molybdenum cofactor cytidylyltransferase
MGNNLATTTMGIYPTMSSDKVYAIVLAAGTSSRLGHNPKQLLSWNNRPLLEHALLNAQAILQDRVIVVLGAHSQAIETDINLKAFKTVINTDWQQGIASSIRAGIQALPETATAALIVLSDQPLIRSEHFQCLLTTWESSPTQIVASEYHQSVGVPALFPARFFAQLQSLQGDQGAKSLLIKFHKDVIKIPLPEAELDIDSIEDFNDLKDH